MPTTIVPRKTGPQTLEIVATAICALACAFSIVLPGMSPAFAAAVALFAGN